MDRPGLSLSDLEGERFIAREEGSATRKTAEQCLAANGVSVKVVMELGSNEAVKQAAAAGGPARGRRGRGKQPPVLPDDLGDFFAVPTFCGERDGYYFGLGVEGLGYRRDCGAAVRAACCPASGGRTSAICCACRAWT